MVKGFYFGGKLLWAGIILGIDLFAKPQFNLIIAVMVAVLLDFITGVTKAKMNKVARTSEGYRKTVVKLMQYTIIPLVLYGAKKLIPEHENLLKEAAGYIMLFIIYIEISSIFENLYEIDKTSAFSKFFIRPVLTILKFGIEHNPVTSAAEKLENEHPELKQKEDETKS